MLVRDHLLAPPPVLFLPAPLRAAVRGSNAALLRVFVVDEGFYWFCYG